MAVVRLTVHRCRSIVDPPFHTPTMSRSPRRSLLRAARWTSAATLAVLALAGCRDVQQQPAAGPEDIGGTMVIASPSEPSTLLPSLMTMIIEKQITDLLFDRLAEIGN